MHASSTEKHLGPTILGRKDEKSLQLTIYALEEATTSACIRKLAKGEKFQNWVTQEAPLVFRMNPESGTSTTPLALYTENEWPNFKEHIIAVEEEEGDENSIREFTKLIEQHEQVWKPAKEELETINVGTEESQRELKIGTLVTQKERGDLIALLRDYVDVFAWSYEDMPGLDTNIIVHRVPLEEGCRPIKQKLRRTHPEILIKVKTEIEKQWNAGFFRSNQISTMGVKHSDSTQKGR